jgi:hypothetical protein
MAERRGERGEGTERGEGAWEAGEGAPAAPEGYRVTLDPAGAVVAGQDGTWTVAVTVGGEGISPGGGVEVVPPRRERQRWRVGQVVAWTDRPGANLRLEVMNCQPLVYHHAQYPVIRAYVEGAPLLPGDTVYVRLGDRGGYVNGFREAARAQEWATEEAAFEVAVDPEGTTRYANRNYPGPGGGAWLPVRDVPRSPVLAGAPVRLVVRAASTPRPGESLRLSVHAEDACDNVASGHAGTATLENLTPRPLSIPMERGGGRGERGTPSGMATVPPLHPVERPGTRGAGGGGEVALRPEDGGARRAAEIRFDGPPVGGAGTGLGFWTVSARDPQAGANGIIGRSNPIAPGFGLADQGLSVYFGELHSHCGLSGDGHRPIDFAYRYARDVTGLDFCALTDHEGGKDWAATLRAAREFLDPGQFVTFVGYEYSRGRRFGHRNVIYRDDDGTHPTPLDTHELWKDLPEGRALVIPHHPNTHSESGTLLGRWVWTDWAAHDPRFQRLVEITQLRGSFERDVPDGRDVVLGGRGSSAQDALAQGLRVGFAGGTDNHRGMPGSRLDNMGGVDPREFRTGGVTAVWAPELTREALFDALHARRTYATTTARILVDFRVNDAPMGSEIARPADGRVRIRAAAIGTAPLAAIEIVRNNAAVYRYEPRGAQAASFEWEDTLGSAAREGEVTLPEGSHYYYLRLRQEDGERAWASPVWVD